ncbi:SH3 domain-containing kinase-binding protein 1 isoform X2 [Tribolium madens]|uniref:SH3 domain-containing kinase-binding protein 1 isoform X2 n=1 Tax=Tribolium madens TaxID=41895 RepID=UPI001CF72AD2|nr:SH3 domain-containing kinase-binding protein 1 isoform X2 [Tribolium madens]
MLTLNNVSAEVLVEHDYIAKEPNELTITRGDIIKDVIKKQGGWWEGTLKDKKGLFPDNFVKVLDKDSSVVLRNRKDASRIRQCRVVFSYKQDHEDELNLNVGDVIDILGEEEEGWWRGILNGKEGVFPSNFVEEIVPLASKHNSKENLTNSISNNETPPPLFSKPSRILCEVKFAYKAQNDDELTLKEGDLVTLISKDGQDPGWWKGELNGVVGVFPDNFVTVLTSTGDEAPQKDERRVKSLLEPHSIKHNTVSAQRKSLEAHSDKNEKQENENMSHTKTTPPLPGKKPTVPLKKSPSGSSSSGGIFQGLKKKLVDVVDGATGSKISPPKPEPSESGVPENVFDDVHRRPLLSDVRASRPKAPGRRPPSIIGKDQEPGLMNGNSDHNMETTSETAHNVSSSSEGEPTESKPKLPEWAKHPAPWLEEMKLNQAKRSSFTPPQDKLRLTPTEKNEDEVKTKSFKKDPSPVDKSKSIAANARVKTPTNEFPAMRNKPNVPIPSKPNVVETPQKPITLSHTKVSPVSNKTPSPMHKIETNLLDSSAGGDSGEEVTSKQYVDLEHRIAKLEELFEKQRQNYEAAIEELRGKLQIETEMRMTLQANFEKFIQDGAIQQL